MANTIKIKRRPASGSAGKPSSLLNGELAFNENDNILYYGLGSGVGGAASTIEQIGGSGYFAHRGGINASGLWPISVTGNSATVTNGVYTTGDQTISGIKTFGSQTIFGGSGINNPLVNLIRSNGQDVIQMSSAGLQIVKEGLTNSFTNAIIIQDNSANEYFTVGQSGTLALRSINTSSNNVGYFAVFDSNPASSTQTLKSVSKSDVLDDIGGASSGIDMTAGSGLVGGGNLTASRTFDIGQGDGISVSADAIAVDSTVVRTTGTQTINGSKTFGNQTSFTSGIVTANISSAGDIFLNSVDLIELNLSNGAEGGSIGVVYDVANKNQQFQLYDVASDNVILAVTDRTSIVCPNTASSGTYFPVFIQNPNAGTSAILSRTASQLKGDIGLGNVTNDAQIKKLASTSGGYVPTWNGTTGDALNIGYSVETTLTGGTGALPRADAVKTYVDNMIVSGIATNDAMIFKGAIDCSTNPNYPAADRGWTYKVSVAGKIGGASGPVVEVNDTLICTTDGTSAGTHASVGSNWTILQTNIVDASILVTGPSSATSGNIAMFDGSTGKIIKDGGFLASDVARLSTNQTFTGTNSFGVINAGYQVVSDPALTIYDDGDNITFRVMSGGSVTAGTWNATTIAVDKGGTGQTSYTNGQLLIGNTTGNTLTKATLTQGSGIAITNGNGSISIAHAATSSLTGAQGSNGIAGITVDGQGHVTAVTTATYLTAGTVCAAIVDCSLDGGSF